VKTAKQREEEFREDLKELLRKHSAGLEVTDDGKPFGMQSGICIITMDGKYENHETIEEFTEFKL